jgi:hypothetical protein
MAGPIDYKRIRTDDFDSELRPVIDRIAFALNPFAEQVIAALNNNLDFNNLNQSITVISNLTVDGSGVPTKKTEFSSKLKTNAKGAICINVTNRTDGTFLTAAPFVTVTDNSGIVKLEHITGLISTKTYDITILLIG